MCKHKWNEHWWGQCRLCEDAALITGAGQCRLCEDAALTSPLLKQERFFFGHGRKLSLICLWQGRSTIPPKYQGDKKIGFGMERLHSRVPWTLFMSSRPDVTRDEGRIWVSRVDSAAANPTSCIGLTSSSSVNWTSKEVFPLCSKLGWQTGPSLVKSTQAQWKAIIGEHSPKHDVLLLPFFCFCFRCIIHIEVHVPILFNSSFSCTCHRVTVMETEDFLRLSFKISRGVRKPLNFELSRLKAYHPCLRAADCSSLHVGRISHHIRTHTREERFCRLPVERKTDDCVNYVLYSYG